MLTPRQRAAFVKARLYMLTQFLAGATLCGVVDKQDLDLLRLFLRAHQLSWHLLTRYVRGGGCGGGYTRM